MKETKTGDRQIIEHTSPVWRLIGVILFLAGIGALGVWVRDMGFERQFATIVTVAAITAATGWARQPDRLRRKFGVFGGIAAEVQNSADRIREGVYARPLRFLVPVGIAYGFLVVGVQALISTLLLSLAAWSLALGVAGILAAWVTVPDFFRDLFGGLSTSDEDEEFEEPEDEDLEDEDELTRRRRAAGEE